MISKKNRKAQVSVIALILIVMIAIVSIAIAWNVLGPLIASRSDEVDIGKFTTTLEIKDAFLFVNGASQITVRRGTGGEELSAMKFVFYDKNENSYVETEETNLINQLETRTYNFGPVPLGNVKKVSVFPVFDKNIGMEYEGKVRDVLEIPQGLVSWWRFEDSQDSVGENDLQATLKQLPNTWHDCVALLQNELLPRDWESYDFINPTVISVWFEKKKGQDAKVLISSPCYGPKSSLLVESLATLDIPANEVSSADEMEQELLIKNVYILTTNISGLMTKGNVEDLWNNHNNLALEVANEVMDIQATLVGHELERNKLIQGFKKGIDGDLEHMCMGRSAPGRLARAIEQADSEGLSVAKLREIQKSTT